MTSDLQASGDVVDVLGPAADHTSVLVTLLVPQGGGRDVVHVLWDGGVVVVQEVARRGRFDSAVGGDVVGLLSDWLLLGNISADGRRDVVDLRTETEETLKTAAARPRPLRTSRRYRVRGGLLAAGRGVVDLMTVWWSLHHGGGGVVDLDRGQTSQVSLG